MRLRSMIGINRYDKWMVVSSAGDGTGVLQPCCSPATV